MTITEFALVALDAWLAVILLLIWVRVGTIANAAQSTEWFVGRVADRFGDVVAILVNWQRHPPTPEELAERTADIRDIEEILEEVRRGEAP